MCEHILTDVCTHDNILISARQSTTTQATDRKVDRYEQRDDKVHKSSK